MNSIANGEQAFKEMIKRHYPIGRDIGRFSKVTGYEWHENRGVTLILDDGYGSKYVTMPRKYREVAR